MAENEIQPQEPTDAKYRAQWAAEQAIRQEQADNMSRRRYAEAVLPAVYAACEKVNQDSSRNELYSLEHVAGASFALAEAMMKEQKRRESRIGGE